MSDIAQIRHGLEEVVGAVALARRKVGEGQLVDLSGLERRVDELCAAIRDQDSSEAQILRPPLLSLIDDLTRLSDDLKAQHGQVASALKGSQSHRSAAAAYRKPQD